MALLSRRQQMNKKKKSKIGASVRPVSAYKAKRQKAAVADGPVRPAGKRKIQKKREK